MLVSTSVEDPLRYPVVLLDVGGTLIGPRGSFGEVYSEVFSEFGIRCDAERFNTAIYATWDEMSRLIPMGADRYTHFEGGENGYLFSDGADLVKLLRELQSDVSPARLKQVAQAGRDWAVKTVGFPFMKAALYPYLTEALMEA